jgi:hypothetical protein
MLLVRYLCGNTDRIFVCPEKGRFVTMFLLALKRGVPMMGGQPCCHWEDHRALAALKIARTGRNEDRWRDVAPVAKIVRTLLESVGSRKLAASLVGWIVLAAVA